MHARLARRLGPIGVCLLTSLLLGNVALSDVLTSADLPRLRNVGGVALSPDGRYIAYTIVTREQPGRPSGQLWVMDVGSGKSVRLGGDKPAGGASWSPDSKWILFHGAEGDKGGLIITHPDGSGATFLATTSGTNSPVPDTGKSETWSPDGKQIAFISSTPSEAAEAASGDPMVITRYLYKPDAGEGMTRFNDNQRLHIFLVDIASKQVRQLTKGEFDEHSIDWSPDGKKLVFASDHEAKGKYEFNIFTADWK